MRHHARVKRRLLNIALILVASVPVVESVAQACGGFFRARTVPAEKRPSLAREKVLLIHDGKREHFIREVAFERAEEPFGFVVPTPSRPEVEPVKEQPFTKLRQTFAYQTPLTMGRGGGLGGGAPGKGSAGVTVLEKKKVGSFTAFVLAATDESALAKWLADNELVSSKEADAWLAHYVKMSFFYVAMRYDPPKGKKKVPRVDAETIRISFDTPLAYYPYLEPEAPELTPQPRLMELWFLGPDRVVPVALKEQRWLRPLRPGETYDNAGKTALNALPRRARPPRSRRAVGDADLSGPEVQPRGLGRHRVRVQGQARRTQRPRTAAGDPRPAARGGEMMRTIAVGLLLVIGCDPPPPKQPAKPPPTKAEAKQAPAPTPAPEPQPDPEVGPEPELAGPAANATADERRDAVLALLTDGKSAVGLPLHAVDEGTAFNPRLGEQMANDVVGVPRVRPKPPVVEGEGLAPEIIRRVIRRHVGALARCYKDPLAGAKATGSFTIEFEVTGEGKTKSVTVTEKDTGLASGAACVTKAAKRWVFPKPQGGGPVAIENAFVINP